MKTIIKAGIALGSAKPLKKVYIGINDAKIDVVSTSELSGYEDAELEIGGWNMVVSPGFISLHTFLSLYPFRYRIFSAKLNANEIINVLSSHDVYYFALLGAYHLLRSGVTSVVFSDKFSDTVARAVEAVGLKPIIAVPVGCNNSPDDWNKEFKMLYNRWSHAGANNVILKVCDQSLAKEVFEVAKEYKVSVLVERTVNLSSFNDLPDVIALGGGGRADIETIRKKGLKLSFTPSFEVSKFPLSEFKPSISLDLVPQFDIRYEASVATTRMYLTVEETFNAITFWGHSQLGLNSGILSSGSDADLVIFRYEEPPAFPLDINSPYESLIFSNYYLETVLVNGEAVLDGGVPINVGLKDVEEGIRRIEEIDKRLGQRIGSLEKS